MAEKNIKESQLEDEEFFDEVFKDIEENGTVYIIETAGGDQVALLPVEKYNKLNHVVERNFPA